MLNNLGHELDPVHIDSPLQKRRYGFVGCVRVGHQYMNVRNWDNQCWCHSPNFGRI